ncbi:hypothetical protein KM176_08305 [Pseudooceanicola sp. CBS1P-1]|uniref:Uncharacterized protein n=1 Tax=Pseudooceanicola albus TaxID=2692189 RepID=A0A6L7G194_9RHOB|nr:MULTISPECIES: DUF6477 family protein [Pseudooceanicola]MBT9383855.1 hypothetical protein [Pseudooceanicola endophyticus]MXN17709.1 hypothetical protein [Pseudooceanicola albus]
MQDLTTMLATLRRPGLLVRAATHAAADYRRERDLARLLGSEALPRRGVLLMQLMALESDLNHARKQRRAEYSPARHVEILASLIAEARQDAAA